MSTPTPPAASSLTLTVALDKEVYAPGEVVSATLTLTELEPFTVTGSGTVDGVTANGTATASVESVPAGAVTFGISDSNSGSWNQVSVNGNTGEFTETLPAAPAA